MAGPMAILLWVVLALLGLPLILIAVLVLLTLRSRRGRAAPGPAGVSATPLPEPPKAIGSPAKAKRVAKTASRRGGSRPATHRPSAVRQRRKS
jgi:hypothetical protein